MNPSAGRGLLRSSVILFAGMQWCLASTTGLDAQWLSWIDQYRPYERNGWHKVMYYEPVFGGWRSEAEDPAFFYSPAGPTNPKAEYLASVEAFLNDTGVLGDEAAQCRHPRRFDWVRSKLPRNLGFPKVKCPALSAFIEQAAPGGMTLIYPASYLNNPASMFGHTFVRVDGAKEGGQRNALLALTVSYGADVSPDENGFVYAFKGLTGLYPGSVRSHPYYRQVQNYNELESRDIWEYPLKLNADQAEAFIKAGWDLKDVNFNYAYLLRNCSYRLLSIMEAAFPEYDLVKKFDVYAVPIDTLRVLNEVGLLGDPRYRPAIASRIHYMATDMAKEDIELSRLLVDNGVEPPETETTGALPEDNQRQVLDLAYEYSRFKAKKAEADMAAVSYGLLRLRAQQPKGQFELTEQEWPADPMRGHGVRRLGLGLGFWGNRPVGRFSFRPLYHDNYDRQAGFLANSQINALQAELRFSQDGAGEAELALDRFDLVDFRSFPPYGPMTPSLAWTGHMGWSRPVPMSSALLFGAEIGLGRAYQTTPNSVGFLLATVGMDTRPELLGGSHLGWIIEVGQENRLGVELEFSKAFLEGGTQVDARLTYNHSLTANRALRFVTEAVKPAGHATLSARLDYYWYF